MNKSIEHSAMILKMNSRLFMNALQGISEEQASERISGHNNPLIWIAVHTVWARYNICAMLGKPAKNPYDGLFEDFKPFDPEHRYATLEEVKSEWKKASDNLEKALDEVSEQHLSSDAPFKSPIGDATMGGTIAFLAQHESYDIGQVAFLKKYFTKEAMSYN